MLFDEFTEFRNFLVIILPVENFPFPASFLDRFLLGLDFFDSALVDQVIKLDLVFDAPDDIKPDFIGFIEKFDFLILE